MWTCGTGGGRLRSIWPQKYGKVDVVRALLYEGATVDLLDAAGENPMDLAL